MTDVMPTAIKNAPEFFNNCASVIAGSLMLSGFGCPSRDKYGQILYTRSVSSSYIKTLLSSNSECISGVRLTTKIWSVSNGSLEGFSICVSVQKEHQLGIIRKNHKANSGCIWSNMEQLHQVSDEVQLEFPIIIGCISWIIVPDTSRIVDDEAKIH